VLSLHFSDDDQPTTGLQGSQNFAQIRWQSWPPEVRFNGRDDIEGAV
jgi:hypothetical protein